MAPFHLLLQIAGIIKFEVPEEALLTLSLPRRITARTQMCVRGVKIGRVVETT